jgi:hypothetical protein
MPKSSHVEYLGDGKNSSQSYPVISSIVTWSNFPHVGRDLKDMARIR